ncbi:protein PXR1-like [Miscanthus floridulus]|uniref:protein PXR1-like n=1 Tax=Miscanthus floridulus TaxID=154761 RepID=UPI0034598CAB
MTKDQYNSDGEELAMEEDKKKKSVAFKAGTSSSKNKSKGKAKKEESSDEECSHDDSDDEALAFFVCKFGKMMKKKGYGARKRRDHFKNKEYVRLCYKCKSPNHVVADCPYNSDNEDNEKKNKKEKKEKKEKKMTFKKKGGSYVVTWDSDASTDDNSSDDNQASKKKALASIAINNKPSLFVTSSCFMVKDTKVNYKARGRHWVLDSGCTQHMTSDSRIFNSIDSNDDNGIDGITFGDNDKGKVKELDIEERHKIEQD